MLHVYYGGSYDPVHRAHIAIACAVRDALDAVVWLLPAADPPHKDGTHADAETRAALLELAVAGHRDLRVDRRELHRAGPSYTVDTLRELRAEYGSAQPLAWLVGGDSLHQLDTWHAWRSIFDFAHVLAVARPGRAVDPATLERMAPQVHRELAPRWRPAAALAGSPSGGFASLALPRLHAESSTGVRAAIASGTGWRSMLPAAVADHVERHRLYGARSGGPAPL